MIAGGKNSSREVMVGTPNLQRMAYFHFANRPGRYTESQADTRGGGRGGRVVGDALRDAALNCEVR